ncbi:hypothetical protein HDU79_009722 [Rhizoclosmatium sp. JEL0117]|nr:hypothetical protein HDU79_009722 [Rhizoclosmatium sp. JEL0117]
MSDFTAGAPDTGVDSITNSMPSALGLDSTVITAVLPEPITTSTTAIVFAPIALLATTALPTTMDSLTKESTKLTSTKTKKTAKPKPTKSVTTNSADILVSTASFYVSAPTIQPVVPTTLESPIPPSPHASTLSPQIPSVPSPSPSPSPTTAQALQEVSPHNTTTIAIATSISIALLALLIALGIHLRNRLRRKKQSVLEQQQPPLSEIQHTQRASVFEYPSAGGLYSPATEEHASRTRTLGRRVRFASNVPSSVASLPSYSASQEADSGSCHAPEPVKEIEGVVVGKLASGKGMEKKRVSVSGGSEASSYVSEWDSSLVDKYEGSSLYSDSNAGSGEGLVR